MCVCGGGRAPLKLFSLCWKHYRSQPLWEGVGGERGRKYSIRQASSFAGGKGREGRERAGCPKFGMPEKRAGPYGKVVGFPQTWKASLDQEGPEASAQSWVPT